MLLERFCVRKRTVDQMKMWPTEWERKMSFSAMHLTEDAYLEYTRNLRN